MSPAVPQRIDALVVENRNEGGSQYRLQLRVDAGLSFLPGQFVMLSPGARQGAPRFDPLLPRPMALYRVLSPNGGGSSVDVEILYKVTGRGTALLAEGRPGQRIGLVGPLGGSFPSPNGPGPAILVGGGTGIASLYDLAARHCRLGSVIALLGARERSDLLGRADFEALGLDLRITTEDGSMGSQGRVTDLLEPLLADHPGATVYACGPTAMMHAAARIAAARGIPCWVSLENHMACGFGVCLGCAVPRADEGFDLVCRDGPVFDATSLDWSGLP